jgi:lysozyme family protein
MATIISYDALRGNYQQLWDSLVIDQKKLPKISDKACKIKANKPRYDEVNEAVRKLAPASQIPWYFIGLVHLMECNLSFNHHLHNGDPLTARTVHVPAKRPATGQPPFTFVQSAVDALIYQGLTAEIDWSIPKMLYRLEAYNGFGYTQYHNMASPYLFAGSNHYVKGKYVSDGKFDANAVSDQIGTAVILKMLV